MARRVPHQKRDIGRCTMRPRRAVCICPNAGAEMAGDLTTARAGGMTTDGLDESARASWSPTRAGGGPRTTARGTTFEILLDVDGNALLSEVA